MPTKPNRSGEQQNYVPPGNGDASGEYTENNQSSSNSKDSKIEELKKRARAKKISIEDLGYQSTISTHGTQWANQNKRDEVIQKLKENGFTKEEIEILRNYKQEQQEKKNQSFKKFTKDLKENYAKSVFGKDVQQNGNKYLWKHYINDDEINIVTNNIQFWMNRGAYVMWVDNNKVVYLKDWQIQPIRNEQGKAYAVKLNRAYFKPYTTYQNDDYGFEKEDTFDDLVKVAKEQDANPQYYKINTGD